MSLETYGNYHLVKRLALGGMAQIYLARRKGQDASPPLVVVKRILPHLAENLEFVRMFLDEARIAARLAHPNIVQLYDLGAQDDSFFLAMEYIHGDDVRRICKRAESLAHPLPVALACRIIIDACAGLDYAHKKVDPLGKPLGIVHRDVSPQNILVSFEGEVKVVDFGIAKAADQATVTRSGVLKGKYSYMSPEQAAGKRVDCRSDVFALGVVLYELLTGTRLFKRSTDMQTLSAVSDCQVTPPSEVSPRVPADLDAIVLKALAKDPDTRYAEAIQLQVALEAWLRAHPSASSQADLGMFMQEVYAERLAREARTGQVVVEEEAPAPVQRAAGEGARRVGSGPSPSSKDVTRADRGEVVEAVALEATALSPMRPLRPVRVAEEVPDPEETDRQRPERRPVTPRPIDVRRPEPTISVHTRTDQDAPSLSITDTTQAPSRRRQGVISRWGWLMGLAAFLLVAGGTALLWVWLAPSLLPMPEVAQSAPVPAPEKPLPQAAPPALPQAPPPTVVALTLETKPSDAKLFVDGQEQQGPSPVVLQVTKDQELEVKVMASDYETATRRVKVTAGPSQLERFVLTRPLRASLPGLTPAPIKTSRGDPLKPGGQPATGRVRFNVTPWARVSCNERILGTTPMLNEVTLPVGVYQCTFHNPELGRTHTQRIEVKALTLNELDVRF
ncbi:serine/threonine-protein kinase [Stigmatella sp. ncwal1]|uniref:Serine/threonine-protein kinase n=1 Tax=Stigmatella ashevillensis TaxID=2995309 RepID=A0ABT5D5W2_9BACT|nr:serine/threonine-protein kinase [Stigmatella ashevillena]